MQANRQEQLSEEAAIIPYYNNFFNTYRLGPEDVISVDVFNQDRYSRESIIVPPSGRISLSLIPGGVFVNGKTVDEVAEIIKKQLRRIHHRSAGDGFARQGVVISLQRHWRRGPTGHSPDESSHDCHRSDRRSRRCAEHGRQEQGCCVATASRTAMLAPIPVNVSAIYKGKAPDTTYLVPGDQIVVPGNKTEEVCKESMSFTSFIGFARIFGVPVP